MKGNKRKFRVDTYSYGVFYRCALSASAARMRVAQFIYGRSYDGYEHEYWEVKEV